MSSVRESATVTVIGPPIDGRRRRKAPQARGQGSGRVARYRIHSDVLRAALVAAGGDPRRLDWAGAAVVDGTITMIRVLNHARSPAAAHSLGHAAQ